MLYWLLKPLTSVSNYQLNYNKSNTVNLKTTAHKPFQDTINSNQAAYTTQPSNKSTHYTKETNNILDQIEYDQEEQKQQYSRQNLPQNKQQNNYGIVFKGQEEVYQQESPQFLKNGQRHPQYVSSDRDDDLSDEDGDDDDDEPIKVRLDLSAFTKTNKTTQEEPPSYNRPPSFQPDFTGPKTAQKNPFNSESTRRTTAPSNDFESDEESQQNPSFYSQHNDNGQKAVQARAGARTQESFQPDQFRKVLSQDRQQDAYENEPDSYHKTHHKSNLMVRTRRDSEFDEEESNIAVNSRNTPELYFTLFNRM